MRRTTSVSFAGAALAAAWLACPAASQAQDGSMDVGNARLSVGAGAERLYLPDVNLTSVQTPGFGTQFKQENIDSDDEYGFAVNGELLVPGNTGSRAFSVQGFYAGIDADSTVHCTGTATQRCGWAQSVPGFGKIGVGPGFSTSVKTERDIDHWGASFEGRRIVGGYSGGMKDGPVQRARYLALGADIRGIHQDIKMRGDVDQVPGIVNFAYDEDLDTNYYGVFLAYGGDYSLPFFGGATSKWGLKSSFRVWGGAYYADTDYRGKMNIPAVGPEQTLSLSSSDAAFIGGLTLETRKSIGPRASLSLRSDYTYYSYVPDMQYNDQGTGAGPGGNIGTKISDDDAFSTRTTLRLNLTLGPRDVVQGYK